MPTKKKATRKPVKVTPSQHETPTQKVYDFLQSFTKASQYLKLSSREEEVIVRPDTSKADKLVVRYSKSQERISLKASLNGDEATLLSVSCENIAKQNAAVLLIKSEIKFICS